MSTPTPPKLPQPTAGGPSNLPDDSRISGSDATRDHSPHTSIDSTAPTLRPGELFGVYRIEFLLGQGGMGAVYKATHTALDKSVAIKVLAPELTRSPRALARFQREMKAVGKLEHVSIVRAMDAGVVQGIHYLAMEYVEGSDLAKLVKERGRLPIAAACQLIRQAALGLAHAHSAGLVHRDIKPANLLMTKEGHVKLLDLGLARLHDGEGDGLTAQGQVMGTPDYMAPEQWENSHEIDTRADIYALGCTLYFLLTGAAPYGGTTHRSLPQKMRGHTVDKVPSLRSSRPEAPDGLEFLVRKLMAKKPEDRPATATEVAAALEPFTRPGTAPATMAPARPVSSAPLTTDMPHGIPAAGQAASSTIAADPSLPAESLVTVRRRLPRWPTLVGLASCAALFLMTIVVIRNSQTVEVIVDNSPEVTAERAAARWVLDLGGACHGKADGANLSLAKAADIPSSQFTIDNILLGHQRDASLEGIEVLNRLTGLRTLNTGTTPFTEAHLEKLNLPELRTLIISASRVGDKGLSHLNRSPKLQTLILSQTTVTDAGLEHVKKLASLTRLDLKGTRVTQVGVRQLAGSLRRCHIESDHGTFEPKSSDENKDANWQAAEWVLRDGGHVEIAESEGAAQTVTTRDQLPPGPFKVVSIYRPNTCPRTVTDGDVDQLTRLPALTWLQLGQTELTDSGLEKLLASAPTRRWRAFGIRTGRITDKGLALLQELDSLTTLNLGGCPITDAGLNALQRLPALKRLDLGETQITDAGLDNIKELPLLHLSLYENPRITDVGIRYLKGMKSLQFLQLAGTSVGDDGLKELSGLKELNILTMDNTKLTESSLPLMTNFPRLEELRMKNLPIGDVGLAALRASKGLKYLGLQGTKVTVAGVKQLAAALPKCRIESDHGTFEPK